MNTSNAMTDLSVTLTLNPEYGEAKTLRAVADKDHIFRVKTKLYAEKESGQPAVSGAAARSHDLEADDAPTIRYWITVQQAGKTVAEKSDIFIIGRHAERPATASPRRPVVIGQTVALLTAGVLFAATPTGKYDGWDYWSTGMGPASRLFFAQETRWLSAADGEIAIPLTPGLHTYHFYAEPVNSSVRFGLNLFFDHRDTIPGITVFAAAATSKTEVPPFDTTSETTMRPDTQGVSGAGTLRYSRGGVTIEVVAFRLVGPAVEKVDVVSREAMMPNGVPDIDGVITLKVSHSR